jgi:hypothetical protein
MGFSVRAARQLSLNSSMLKVGRHFGYVNKSKHYLVHIMSLNLRHLYIFRAFEWKVLT